MKESKLGDPESADFDGAQVYDITDAAMAGGGTTEPTRESVDNLLEDDSALGRMHKLAERARGINSATLAGMSLDTFEQAVAGAGSGDEKLALAEYYGTLAKAGITPANSVKGFDELQQLLSRMEVESQLQPVELQLKILQLRGDIAILQRTQELVLRTRINEHTIAAEKSDLDLLKARHKGAVEGVLSQRTEVLRRDESLVELDGRTKSLDTVKKYQDYDKDTERLAHKIKLQKDRKRLLRRELVAPRLRIAVILLTLLIVVANLVADGPTHRNAPILGAVNSSWDGIYMPIRAGIIRTAHGGHTGPSQTSHKKTTHPSSKNGALGKPKARAKKHPRKAKHRAGHH